MILLHTDPGKACGVRFGGGFAGDCAEVLESMI
jgi:hypothetical protein